MNYLQKDIKLNSKFILVLLLVNIIIIGIYYSYALFEITVIQNSIVKIETGTIDVTTTITGYDTPSFTLSSGETKELTVALTSTATGDIGYKMYYDITSGVSDFIVTSTETFPDDIVEGVMNATKTITFTFQNTGSNDITILLGTQGGLQQYSIPLEQGIELKVNEELGTPVRNAVTTAINNPTDTSCKTHIIEDGITYISGTKTCINFNYVWYSGKLWRITAIYPDGTMKMITDDLITNINWGATSTVSSTDLTSAYSTSWMREWLNQEFLPTLYNYENIIEVDAGWYSITDSSSTPVKPTGEYTLTDPVGLLNAYEYYMSYKNTSYSNGYLNIGYYWWLITPYSSSGVRTVYYRGNLDYNTPYSISNGARPSINLKSSIQLKGGSGTISDPYTIKGDIEEATASTTLLNTRVSGEYVKLENDESSNLFRIVDKELVGENLTTKLVLNDYIKDSDSVLTKYFSVSTSHELWSEVDKTDTTYWRGYLNTTWLGTLDTSMLEKGTYYLGYQTSSSYKNTVCSTVSSEVSIKECIENGTVVSNKVSDDYVGLLRVGEMFASQTSDYTYSTAESMWLITPYSSSSSSLVRCVGNYGGLSSRTPYGYSLGARPSINLNSTIIVKSGSGTKNDPFVVSLPTT